MLLINGNYLFMNKIMYKFTLMYFLFIITTIITNATSPQDLLKMVGEKAKAEHISPSCFIMHADQEEPEIINLHVEIISIMRIAGLNVLYASQGDNKGLSIGGNIQEYMRKGILESGFIFALYSPKFFERSKNPLSGISTEINILIERLQSGTLTCFIPIIISGKLETSVPYCLRSLLASQSPSEDLPFSIDMFITNLLHLLYYRIFSHSESIKTMLSSALEPNNYFKQYLCDQQSPSLSVIICSMSSLNSTPENYDTETIPMSTQPKSPFYMSSLDSRATQESQEQ